MVNGRTPTAGRIIGVVTLAVALFEVTRSALLFGFFGVGSEKDLIDAAFVVPDLLLVVFGGAHLIVALRPMLEPGDEPDADWEVRRATMASLRLVSLSHAAATIVAISLAQPLAATLFPALSETDRIAGMMRTSLAAHMLAAVTIVLFIAESTRNPRSPAWLMAAFQIAGFGLGGILGGSDRTPESFVWGLLVGSAVAVAVAAWRFERAGMTFEWNTPWRHRSLPPLIRRTWPLTLLSLAFAAERVLPGLAGQFAGDGAVGVLTGARAVAIAAVGIGTVAAGLGGIEPEASTTADNRWFRALVTSILLKTVTIATFATALIVGLARPFVATIFGYGAIDEPGIEAIATSLIWFGVGIAPMSLAAVYLRAQARSGQVHRGGWAGLVASALAVPALSGLLDSMGSTGVGIGWLVWCLIAAAVSGVWWHRAGTADELTGVTRHVAGSLVAAAAAGGVATVLAAVTTSIPGQVVVVVGGVVSFLVWRAVLRLVGASITARSR